MRFLILSGCVLFCGVAAFAASQNYEKLITNPDASVTIVNPRFRDVDGNLRIGRNSDLDGVCKLYGYPKSLNAIMTYDSVNEQTVAIGADGRLQNLNSGFFPLSAVVCDASTMVQPTADTEAESITANDDGSYSLKNPKYSGIAIGRNSDLDGICKLFGFTKNLNGAMEYDSVNATTVTIGADARLHSLNSGFFPIRLLVCDK